MKVFALLLSFLLFVSCSTYGLHDWDGFFVGLGHPAVEFSSYGEEEASEPTAAVVCGEPQEVHHMPFVPYDINYISRIDWEALRPIEQEAYNHDDPETIIIQEPSEDITQEDVADVPKADMTGDDIVLLACMVLFLLIIMVASVTVVRGRRRD